MKWSIYNVVYTKDCKTKSVYNYATGSIIILLKELAEIIHLHISDMDLVSKIHPDLYQTLVKKRFIVDDDIDEKKLAIDNINKKLSSQDTLRITINPTLSCNLKCWYCYESHIVNSYMDANMMHSIKKYIEYKLKDEDSKIVKLSFFGGEPLLRARRIAIPLLEHISDLCKFYNKKLYVTFITNAVLLNAKILNEIKEICTSIVFQIPFDGNEFEHNKTKRISSREGSYHIVLANTINALKEGFYVNIRFNYTLENIESFSDLINDIEAKAGKYKKQITIHLQRVWQVPQSDELYDKLNQIKQILVTRGFNNNMVGKGSLMYPCYADFDNSYVINYNGDVFKCTARDFKEKERIGVLNNDGIITFNSSFLERKSRRFLTPCKDCKALPICTICSQTKYESINNNICPYGILDKDIDDQIYFRYKALLSGK